MSKQPLNPEAVEEVQRILKEHNITAVALERAFTLYDNIAAILLRYKDLPNDAFALEAMEKEMVVLFAKEIDKNFYEGMLESVIRSMSMVANIPAVKQIQKDAQAKLVQKLAATDSPEADKVKDILNKLLGNLGGPKAPTSSTTTAESVLETFGVGSRVKKEDLN